MQTFLPHPDFVRSARVLDDKRLGKQRAETKQILKALRGDYDKTGAWVNHPATVMWRGHSALLGAYGVCIVEEWLARGYNDTTLDFFHEAFEDAQVSFPSWLGDDNFHTSHQSNLIRKDPTHYGPLFPGVPDNLEYVWPTNTEDVLEIATTKVVAMSARPVEHISMHDYLPKTGK